MPATIEFLSGRSGKGPYRQFLWRPNRHLPPHWAFYGFHYHHGPETRAELRTHGRGIARHYAQWKRLDARKRLPETLFASLWPIHVGTHSIFDYMSKWCPHFSEHLARMRQTLLSMPSNPWEDAGWFVESPYCVLHGLHTSEENPDMLAYARTVEAGAMNKWVRIKPGKYLTQFFPHLGENTIRKLTEYYVARNKKHEVRFIASDDKDGWRRVYKYGPSSCMAEMPCVHVYAHPYSVLRLAYQEIEDVGIISRAIVREDTTPKQYVRVYPNPDNRDLSITQRAFQAELERLGYVHGNLNGVLLDYCPGRNEGYDMPYLDTGKHGTQRVSLVREHSRNFWKVHPSGDYEACSQEGFINTGAECPDCGGDYEPEDGVYIDTRDETVCPDCAENYVEAISRNGTMMTPVDDCSNVDGDWYVSRYMYDLGVVECTATGELRHRDNCVQVAPDGAWVDAEYDGLVKIENPTGDYLYELPNRDADVPARV